MVVVVVRSHQSVNWSEYFEGIKTQCPWSLVAWLKGKIDIVSWQGCDCVTSLGDYKARMYTVKNVNKRRLKKLCKKLDHGECEWLWSYPGYGPYATPCAVLIQQSRQELNDIRKHL